MKINQVFPEWPHGTVVTTAFLEAHGVSRKLASQYCGSDWLEDVGRDAFESAQALMEALPTLRPKVVQSLLESCTSVKVKRLCLYLGDHLALPWRKRLDDSRIDLGTGKRQIVPGGRLDVRYGITVPRDSS